MSVQIVPPQISLEQLRDVVAGRATTVPRRRAFALLASRDFPEKERDFASLLESEKESPRIRYLAAISLGKIGTTAAFDALVRGAQLQDERILAGVVTALGFIGGKPAMDAILRVKNNATDAIASHARFAAALISHRLGLEGNDLPVPGNNEFLKLPPGNALPIQLAQPTEREASLCQRSLALEQRGDELARGTMYQVRCRRSVLMIVLSQESVNPDAAKRLLERKTLLGLVATKSEDARSYSTSFLLLTSPAKQSGSVNILIHRSGGAPAFVGTAQAAGNHVAFSIRAVSRPGSIPVEIDGTFEDGRLDFKTALAAAFVHEPRQPIEGLQPHP